MHERDRLLEELGRLHDEWQTEMATQVAYQPETDKPHHPETGETDYPLHYTDASATAEQEQVFQDKIADVLKQLAALGQQTQPEDDATDLMDKVSETEEFALAVNGDAVLMLLKTDHEAGLQSYREGGVWVGIDVDDDLPALDEADLIEVVGEATEIWDAKEGHELSLREFKEVALDQIG